ncbi:MAG: hypothetical protein M1539_06020 [Actinobacteria bacterium]|nr:hypothetical protein [Actinomycetota bacterium]
MTHVEEIKRQREAWLVLSAVIELMNERIPKVGKKDKADLQTTVSTLGKLAQAIQRDMLEELMKRNQEEMRQALKDREDDFPPGLVAATEEVISALDHWIEAWQEDETSLTAATPTPH